MAIIDISWFRPDIIKPTSPVPTGIGAVAFLDRLQEFLGLENHQDTCEKMIKLQKSIGLKRNENSYQLILNIYRVNVENILVMLMAQKNLKERISSFHFRKSPFDLILLIL